MLTKKESSQNNVVERVGEKSHRNVTNVTLQESFVCLFLERPKENKRPLPSLSVPMKILPISLTSEAEDTGDAWQEGGGQPGPWN